MKLFLPLASLLSLTLSSPVILNSDPPDTSPDTSYASVPWPHCPPHWLNCSKCPADVRCPSLPLPDDDSPQNSKWPRPNSTPNGFDTTSQFTSPELDEPAALTGPQLAHFPQLPESESSSADSGVCALQRCRDFEGYNADGYVGKGCGSNAFCIRGHCACKMGWKASAGDIMVKGVRVPEVLRMWVDVGVGCNERCADWLCKGDGGMEKSRVCFEAKKGEPEGENDVGGPGQDAINSELELGVEDGEDTHLDIPLIALTKGHGAIQLPGAAIDEDGGGYARM